MGRTSLLVEGRIPGGQPAPSPRALVGGARQGSAADALRPMAEGRLALVVEDNDLNRRLFCELLRTVGVAAICDPDGLSSVDLAERHVPDVVLMDLQLPRVSGLELIRRMRARRSVESVPIIAISAFARPTDASGATRAGADLFLPKPVDTHRLREAVCALAGIGGELA